MPLGARWRLKQEPILWTLLRQLAPNHAFDPHHRSLHGLDMPQDGRPQSPKKTANRNKNCVIENLEQWEVFCFKG